MSRYARQSFLGAESERALGGCRVAIVGLGGGGSHISQQLAHLGFSDFVLFDPDCIDESNLNRLIGGTVADVVRKAKKTTIAERVIRSLQPNAKIGLLEQRWQERPEILRGADIVFGCVDGFRERDELERTCRRYLIPLIDIGLDVHIVDSHPPRMAGQVILSVPGGPCFRCLGFITDDLLSIEAGRYGDAGDHPQVVWANGVLASTAVGIAVDVLTAWSGSCGPRYLQYDGNRGTVTPSIRLQFAAKTCLHYADHEVGEPTYRSV